MSQRIQLTLEGFRPSANPQPESPPSPTDYMLMLKDLITAAQADISSVIDPIKLDAKKIADIAQAVSEKPSLDEFTGFDCGFAATFCTDAGRFYADLQADALQNNDTDSFVAFGHRMETARILQDVLLSARLQLNASARAAAIMLEYKYSKG